MSRAAFALLVTGAPTAAAAQEAGAVDRLMAGHVSATSPGCSVAARKDGRTVLSRGYGLANLEHRVPITPKTRFDIGSVSKQFTAAGLLLLAEEGKLSLQDDVRKHIPELPDYGTKISIDQLLDHTSGLRDFTSLVLAQGWYPLDRRETTPAENLQSIIRQRQLNFRPGTAHAYANSGYVLAAEIIRRVSGQSLRDFMQKRFFQPLGMTSTEVGDDFRRLVPDRADAYAKRGDEWRLSMPRVDVQGAGAIISTPEDLLLWSEALDSGRFGPFVTSELHREGRTSDGLAFGYARGLVIKEYKGVREVGHVGGFGGYFTQLVRFPQQGLSIAVACNLGRPAEPFGYAIADAYLKPVPAAKPKAPKIVELSREQLAPLEGRFLNEFSGQVSEIKIHEGKLLSEGTVLTPSSPTEFHTPAGGRLTFRTPDVADLLRPDGGRRTLRRIAGPPPTQAQLAALGGRYRSEEAAATYEATVKDGKLVMRPVDGPDIEILLNPLGSDLFNDGIWVFRFLRDERGVGEAFLFSLTGVRELRFERLPPGR